MRHHSAADLTVVIPAYNAAATIENAVASAFRATAARVIVVDDGSADDTASLAKQAGAEVIVQANAGASAARSEGARNVTTTYVTFLDADDVLLEEGVMRSVEILGADDTLAVAAGRVMGFVGDGEARLLPQTYTDVNTRTLLVTGYGPWPPGAAVQRTALMRKAEAIEPTALRPRYAEDYELLIRMSLVGGVIRHDVPSMKYEMAGGKSARSAGSAIASKEAIREHYARALEIPIELMAPMRMRAAANKRVARGYIHSGKNVQAIMRMTLAYAQGALSLAERRRLVGNK
jgi:glycosyltransferase involved in cell wall biosynthesis